MARFLHDHLGNMLPSPSLFVPIGNRFRREVHRFAERRGIPILRLKKPDRTPLGRPQARPRAAESLARGGDRAVGGLFVTLRGDRLFG